MGRTFKYYPSSPFSPSVALGALLTRNWGVLPGGFMSVSLVPSDSYAVGTVGIVGTLGLMGIRSCVSPRCRYSARCTAL